MAKSISILELKDVVKTLEEEVLPLLEEVKNLNEVQIGISSIDLETRKKGKGAEKNKESAGMGVVNTKEKELLNKQEELIKVYKQLEKLQDEKVKQLTQEHEEEKKLWLQEEEFKERKLERLEYDLIECEYRLQCKICIEEDLVNLRDELEEKRHQQVAKYEEQLAILRDDLEVERGMRRQIEESKAEELRLLRTELEAKEEELKKLAEIRKEVLQDEIFQQLTQEHEEEKKLWLQEEKFKERKLERLENDLIEYEYRLQCKICIEEDLVNLRDELEEKRRQQVAKYEEQLAILRDDLEAERGMRRQIEESKEEELRLLTAELEAKEEELKKLAEIRKEVLQDEIIQQLMQEHEEEKKLWLQEEKLQDKKIKQLTQEHEEEIKSWLQEEEFKQRNLERLEYDLIEYEYRLQCKICIEEDLLILRDELEGRRLQQEAGYEEQLQILRNDFESERGMWHQLQESKEEELRLLRTELEGKEEDLMNMAERQLEAINSKEQELELLRAELEEKEEELKTATRKKPTTKLKQYLLSKIMKRRQKEAKHRAAAEFGPDWDSQGRTELHRAAKRGDTHRVQLLLYAGSQVNAVDHAGCTPLWLAADEGHQDACRALLAAGALPDVKSRPCGWTALHQAALSGHHAVCELLLAAGARPNEPDDEDGCTALHWAAGCGHAPVVQLLLEYGAQRGARDKRGRTALDLARKYECTEVDAMLLG
ncbi:golgin subfamily A member 6-like protein 25 isoform X4 [Periplaneta americana]|uniref:golgin subfamily A member 6-like protein 25 isoform X4 n=1 Tax=Periplaneta americana TaxID=6978 RepID=UPI0037E75CDF